jgi:hypothetical protein
VSDGSVANGCRVRPKLCGHHDWRQVYHALREEQITLKEVRKDAQYEIYVRGRLLITVTQADADAAKMSVKQIAEHWLKQLRRTLPEVSARPPQ